MAENLSVTIEQRRSGARLIKLVGTLDDQNRLRELGTKLGAGAALINLAGVERIDESGTRVWMKWLARLEAKGIRPALIACSPAVVAHLNRVEDFAGHAIVKSFQVPYHCAACELDKFLLVHLVEMGEDPRKVPGCSCDVCGAPMTCTEDAEQYLAFVRRMRATQSEQAPRLARGSSSSVTTEHLDRVSEPALPEPAPHGELDLSPALPAPANALRHALAVALVLVALTALAFVLAR